MGLIKIFLIVFLVCSAVCDDPLVRPCKKDDIACLSSAAQNFLEKSSSGFEQLDIKAIDPLHIPHVEVDLDSGKKVHLKNVVVTGMKRLDIHDFKIDTVKKSVLLAMENDPEIVADIEVESKDNRLSGPFAAKGKVIPTAKYTYDLVPNDKGVEYFTVGPETITCRLEGTPEITVSNEIGNSLWKDETQIEELKKRLLCSIMSPAFSTVIHNLRASAKVYPKTAYFVDL